MRDTLSELRFIKSLLFFARNVTTEQIKITGVIDDVRSNIPLSLKTVSLFLSINAKYCSSAFTSSLLSCDYRNTSSIPPFTTSQSVDWVYVIPIKASLASFVFLAHLISVTYFIFSVQCLLLFHPQAFINRLYPVHNHFFKFKRCTFCCNTSFVKESQHNQRVSGCFHT